jgi:HAD superfamily hydrolase (TIGR01549 family)
MIKGVVFDMDGTLVHLPINYELLYQELRKILKTTEIKQITDAVSKLNDEQRGTIYQIWTRLELEALPSLKVNHEGIRIYNKFSNKPSALITLQGKEVVKRIIETLNLSFAFILSREDSYDRVEQLKMTAEKLDLKTQDVLMVGDRESDRKAAQKLGCQFLMVQDHTQVEHLLTQNFK